MRDLTEDFKRFDQPHCALSNTIESFLLKKKGSKLSTKIAMKLITGANTFNNSPNVDSGVSSSSEDYERKTSYQRH